MHFTTLQKKKRSIGKEEEEAAAGGEKAWNTENHPSHSLLQFPSRTQVDTYVYVQYKHVRARVPQILNNVFLAFCFPVETKASRFPLNYDYHN